MTTHSSISAQEIPWTEEPGGLQSVGCTESHVPEQLSAHTTPFTDEEADPRGVMTPSNARGQCYQGEMGPKCSHFHLDEFREVAE